MTAISPLQSIHKKGLFGDHHKKNEIDLIKINEVTNLIVIQIVQYKNSKIKLENLDIDGLKLPLQNLKIESNENTRILWNAPNTWLVLTQKVDILKNIEKNCNTEDFAITDISHSRAIIKISGTGSTEVLKKGCPINFNIFKKNNCVGSVFHGINIIIDCVDDKTQTFNLITFEKFWRIFISSYYRCITRIWLYWNII